MRKFILIDPSIKGQGGHYFEYAERVLRAASRAGFDCYLATHKKFDPAEEVPWKVFPEYSLAFFVVPEDSRLFLLLRDLAGALGRWKDRLLYRGYFSRIGLFVTRRKNPKNLLNEGDALSQRTLFCLAVSGVMEVGRRIVQFFKAVIPFKPYLKAAFSALGSFLAFLFSPFFFLLKPPEWFVWGEANRRKQKTFRSDTARLLEKVGASRGDIVFVPTLGEQELVALRRLFAKNPSAGEPSWHLLFRRNIFTGREPEYKGQEEGLRVVRNAFQSLLEETGGGNIFFYTDTDILTRQYGTLVEGDFQTAPIPVEEEVVPRGPAAGEGGPAKVIYLGDARPEKGFQHLPRMVSDLHPRYGSRGKVTFTFQSYFSVAGGEPPLLLAKSLLQSWPAEVVKLVDRPLSGVEYTEMLNSGDIVLIPYDRNNYYARSSGILVEALVAGKPVVVPSGTWMSLLLEPGNHSYRNGIVEKAEKKLWIQGKELSECILEKARRRKKWTIPNGDALVLSVQIPRGADHLFFSFDLPGGSHGLFLSALFEPSRRDKRRLPPSVATLGGFPGSHSCLVRLQGRPKEVRITLKCALGTKRLLLENPALCFLFSVNPLPLWRAGAIYEEPEHLSCAVAEILDHFAHYSASARKDAPKWSSIHNPDRLVSMLTEKGGTA